MSLIDTCLWIPFLRGKSTPRVHLLERLLEDGEAHLCEITYAEICFGARSSTQLESYRTELAVLPFLSLPVGWHERLAQMGNEVRRAGHQPFIGDCMIAMTALAHEMDLLTDDRDFDIYKKLFGLRLN